MTLYIPNAHMATYDRREFLRTGSDGGLFLPIDMGYEPPAPVKDTRSPEQKAAEDIAGPGKRIGRSKRFRRGLHVVRDPTTVEKVVDEVKEAGRRLSDPKVLAYAAGVTAAAIAGVAATPGSSYADCSGVCTDPEANANACKALKDYVMASPELSAEYFVIPIHTGRNLPAPQTLASKNPNVEVTELHWRNALPIPPSRSGGVQLRYGYRPGTNTQMHWKSGLSDSLTCMLVYVKPGSGITPAAAASDLEELIEGVGKAKEAAKEAKTSADAAARSAAEAKVAVGEVKTIVAETDKKVDALGVKLDKMAAVGGYAGVVGGHVWGFTPTDTPLDDERGYAFVGGQVGIEGRFFDGILRTRLGVSLYGVAGADDVDAQETIDCSVQSDPNCRRDLADDPGNATYEGTVDRVVTRARLPFGFDLAPGVDIGTSGDGTRFAIFYDARFRFALMDVETVTTAGTTYLDTFGGVLDTGKSTDRSSNVEADIDITHCLGPRLSVDWFVVDAGVCSPDFQNLDSIGVVGSLGGQW